MVCFAALRMRTRLRGVAIALTLATVVSSAESVFAQSHGSGHATQGARQYTVRSGDTLDRIISQQMGSNPFSVVFLRDALARLNPHALPQGARGVLLAGATLQIPDACALQQLAFGGTGGCDAPSVPAAGEGRTSPMSTADRMEIERRSWVRYP